MILECNTQRVPFFPPYQYFSEWRGGGEGGIIRFRLLWCGTVLHLFSLLSPIDDAACFCGFEGGIHVYQKGFEGYVRVYGHIIRNEDTAARDPRVISSGRRYDQQKDPRFR